MKALMSFLAAFVGYFMVGAIGFVVMVASIKWSWLCFMFVWRML
jgi:hypothetical protein